MKEFNTLTRNYYIVILPAAVLHSALMFFTKMPFYVSFPMGIGTMLSFMMAGMILQRREVVQNEKNK